MNNDTTFCIPVRGGSRRIPRKNLIDVGGETLLGRKIRQLLPLGEVVVGSDDDEMLDEARRCGATVIRRSKTNEGHDSANDMIGEFMNLIKPCVTVVWAHCTNPLLSTETYGRALDAFWNDRFHDSLVSVHEIHGHFWDCNGVPMYDLEQCRVRHICANDLPPMYEQDGGIFIQHYDQMKRNCYFFGERPLLFPIPEEEFLDINTMHDVKVLMALIDDEHA